MSQTEIIQPRTLKGFRDYLPAVMMPRESMMQTARETFRSFGYAPIDTPVLEYKQILTGKGSDETDRQLYSFVDNGGREVAMRFDLTVPLARFAAQHIGVLGTPFRRYHIAPVYRGENTQAGRYREFMQADFDIIGPTGEMADIEIVAVIGRLMANLGLANFTISMNNRAILTGLLQHLGLADRAVPILRSLDKLSKIGREKTAAEMVSAAAIDPTAADAVLSLADLDGDADQTFQRLPDLVGQNELAIAGIDRLRRVYDGAIAAGVPSACLRIDVSIARGLDYYTGMIFETTLDDLPGIGSVCSGGRYDNLAGLYTKQTLPGIGASLGLDRLIAAMEQLDRLSAVSTPAPTLITYFDVAFRDAYLKLACNLRNAGVANEMYPEPKKLKAQLKYANDKGFEIAIVAGSDEWAAGQVQVKDLASRQSQTVRYDHSSPQSLIESIASTRRSIADTMATETSRRTSD